MSWGSVKPLLLSFWNGSYERYSTQKMEEKCFFPAKMPLQNWAQRHIRSCNSFLTVGSWREYHNTWQHWPIMVRKIPKFLTKKPSAWSSNNIPDCPHYLLEWSWIWESNFQGRVGLGWAPEASWASLYQLMYKSPPAILLQV